MRLDSLRGCLRPNALRSPRVTSHRFTDSGSTRSSGSTKGTKDRHAAAVGGGRSSGEAVAPAINEFFNQRAHSRITARVGVRRWSIGWATANSAQRHDCVNCDGGNDTVDACENKSSLGTPLRSSSRLRHACAIAGSGRPVSATVGARSRSRVGANFDQIVVWSGRH